MADTSISLTENLVVEPEGSDGVAVIKSETDVRNISYSRLKGLLRAGLASTAGITTAISTHTGDADAHHVKTPAGGIGIDQVARDAASDAQSDADAAQMTADDAATETAFTTHAGNASAHHTKTPATPANRLIPSGGELGQIIKKNTDSDYDVSWQDDTGNGGGGGALVVSATARFARTQVLDSSPLPANPSNAREFVMTEDIAAGAIYTIELEASPGAYALFESDDLLAKAAQSTDPFTGELDEALSIEIHNTGDQNWGHEAMFVWQSDEANKIWIKTGRDDQETVSIYKHAIAVTTTVTGNVVGGDPYTGTAEASALDDDFRFLLQDPNDAAALLHMEASDVRSAVRLDRGLYSNTVAYKQGDIAQVNESGIRLFWIASADISAGGGTPSQGNPRSWYRLAGEGFHRGNLITLDTYQLKQGDTYRIGLRFFVVVADVVDATGTVLLGSSTSILEVGAGAPDQTARTAAATAQTAAVAAQATADAAATDADFTAHTGNSSAHHVKTPAGGGGSTTFIGLTDTPSSYAAPTKILQVNALGIGLEFVDAPSGGQTFTPSQSNIYDAVAAIVTGNVTEDDSAHTIEVLAAGGASLTTSIPAVIAGTVVEMNPWAPAGAVITQAHGLGRVPDFMHSYIECVAASDGYAVGDVIPEVHFPWRVTVRFDATNVYVIPSNSSLRFGIADVTGSHNSDDFTASAWKYVVTPYINGSTSVVGLKGDKGDRGDPGTASHIGTRTFEGTNAVYNSATHRISVTIAYDEAPLVGDGVLFVLPAVLDNTTDALDLRIEYTGGTITAEFLNANGTTISAGEIVPSTAVKAFYFAGTPAAWRLIEPTDLTVAQATDDASDYFGLVSGELLSTVTAASSGIDLVTSLPSSSSADRKKVYGLRTGTQSSEGLYFRKHSERDNVNLRVDDVTSRETGVTARAFGWATIAAPAALRALDSDAVWGSGVQTLSPSNPGLWQALLRTYTVTSGLERYYFLVSSAVAPYNIATIKLQYRDTADDSVIGTVTCNRVSGFTRAFVSADSSSSLVPINVHRTYNVRVLDGSDNPIDLLDAADHLAQLATIEEVQKEVGAAVTDPPTRANVYPIVKAIFDGAVTESDTAETITVDSGGGGTDVQTFNASGIWTKPAGVEVVLIELLGAGGGGAQSTSNPGGGGGGGGFRIVVSASFLGNTEAVTVGAGGGPGFNGTDGGDTSFWAVHVGGGSGGASNNVGNGGTPFDSNEHPPEYTGGNGRGGSSIFGGGGGGRTAAGVGQTAGTTGSATDNDGAAPGEDGGFGGGGGGGNQISGGDGGSGGGGGGNLGSGTAGNGGDGWAKITSW